MTLMRKLATIILAATIGFLGGCGGGGGSSSSTTAAGTVSKGIFTSGIVSIYAIDGNGTRSTTPLATGTIDGNGHYTIPLGAYSGAVVIEATGTYVDEATGQTVTVAAGRPMRAVATGVDSSAIRRIAVTPLTDLAYNLAGSPLTVQNIQTANARVADIFKISDITAVEPPKADAAVLGTASTDQQAYTLALAALSQIARTANPGGPASFSQITSILDSFRTDLLVSAAAGLGNANVASFSSALSVATSSQLPGVSGSLSGLTTAAATLSSVGTTSLKLTLSVAAPPSGTLVGAIQGTLTFPTGTLVRVKPATNREILNGLFNASGNAAGSLATASFNSPSLTFGVISGSGFAGGEFATVTVDVSSGTPSAASFSVGSLEVLDVSGAPLPLAVTAQ